MSDFWTTLISNYKEEEQLLISRRELLGKVKEIIKNSGFRDDFIMKELDMEKGAFYRRMNKPSLWTFEEIEKLSKILKRNQ